MLWNLRQMFMILYNIWTDWTLLTDMCFLFNNLCWIMRLFL